MSSLGTATRIAADTGANLAKGIGDVAKAKAADIGDTAKSRIRETLGGKIATAIKASGQQGHAQEAMPEPAPTFSDNSLAAADTSNTDTDADPASEVAAFVQRGGGPDEKTA